MPNLPHATSRAWRCSLVALVWGLVPASVLENRQPCSIAATFHRPCPGCGLTRATLLMLEGHVHASIAMHPLAVPMVACWLLFAFATVRATWRQGVPWFFYRERFGRHVALATTVTYVALIAVWVLREYGMLGGRVPVT